MREEKIVEGCDLYAQAAERAKQGERTISMDELTGVQALQRKHPDLPMQPGHVLRREFEYIRHGTLSWFINFEVATGQVIEPSWGPTRCEEDGVAHLQRLIASSPETKRWHLIMDNLDIHRSESLVRKLLKRGNFPSLDDLRDQILAFIAYYNRTMAKPIKWTYTGLSPDREKSLPQCTSAIARRTYRLAVAPENLSHWNETSLPFCSYTMDAYLIRGERFFYT